MRVPDRPWEATNAYSADVVRAGWDHQARSDGLAERLTRLLAGHPSADLRTDPDWGASDPDDWDLDDLGAGDYGAGDYGAGDYGAGDYGAGDYGGENLHADEDPDGLPPDDLESGVVGLPSDDPSGGIGTRRAAGMPKEGLGGDASSGYRPWFAADGAGDPWFAEPTG